MQTAVPEPAPRIPQSVVAPAQQVKPSSQAPSQSSSTPLQASGGGVHDPTVQLALQASVPAELQVVVHEPSDVPATQGKPSSGAASQSSSRPLQVSSGGT